MGNTNTNTKTTTKKTVSEEEVIEWAKSHPADFAILRISAAQDKLVEEVREMRSIIEGSLLSQDVRIISVREICTATGVNRSTVSRWFSDPDGLKNIGTSDEYLTTWGAVRVYLHEVKKGKYHMDMENLK